MKIVLTTAALLAVTASVTVPAAASPLYRGFGGPHIIRGLPVFGGFHPPLIRGLPVFGGFHPPRIRGIWVNGPWTKGPWGGIPGPRGVPVLRPF